MMRNEYLSVEPAMRGWVAATANYSTLVGIGEVMRSFSAGTVVASRQDGASLLRLTRSGTMSAGT
jgi:NADPH-dependent curcumin reductase CurA